MERPLARRLWFGLEPIHGMIYFVPEGPDAYEDVGVTGSRAGYFASRSAPMGAVTAATVTATFYNFHPDLIRRALDGVWEAVQTFESNTEIEVGAKGPGVLREARDKNGRPTVGTALC